MSQTMVGILCLAFSVLACALQAPSCLVSIHQLRDLRQKGKEMKFMATLRLWAPLGVVLMCISVGIVGVILLVDKPARPSPSTVGSPSGTGGSQPVNQGPDDFSKAKAKDIEGAKHPPSRTAGEITQGGFENQQTVNRAPVIQSNSGGCNQQVVGGNNNTNNCAPPSRLLSESDLSKFENTLLASREKSHVLIKMASGSEDTFPLARQICDGLSDAGWGVMCPASRSSQIGRDVSVTGLQCFSSDWSVDSNSAFKEALGAAGLKCQFVDHTYDLGRWGPSFILENYELRRSGLEAVKIVVLIGSPGTRQ